jgi:hypothetical protein
LEISTKSNSSSSANLRASDKGNTPCSGTFSPTSLTLGAVISSLILGPSSSALPRRCLLFCCPLLFTDALLLGLGAPVNGRFLTGAAILKSSY